MRPLTAYKLWFCNVMSSNGNVQVSCYRRASVSGSL